MKIIIITIIDHENNHDRPSTIFHHHQPNHHLNPLIEHAALRECMSTQLDRGAVLCGPSGAVAFPHQRLSRTGQGRTVLLDGGDHRWDDPI
jgi:hypothetical protein